MHDYYDEYVLEQQAHNALRNTVIAFAAKVTEMEGEHEEEVERLENELQAAITARDKYRARAATARKEVEALKAKADASTSLKRDLDAVTKERNDLKLRVQALEASLHQSTSDIVDIRQHYEGRLEDMRQLLPADQRAASSAPGQWARPIASNLIAPRAASAPRTSREEAAPRPVKRRLVVSEPPATGQ